MPGPQPVPTPPPVPRLAALAAAADLLRQTGSFRHVHAGRTPPDPWPSPDLLPAVWIRPTRWSTTGSRGGDEGDEFEERTVTLFFDVEVTTERDDEQLEVLAELAATTLRGKALGPSLPGLTLVDGGTYSPGVWPANKVTLSASLTYLEDQPS